MKRKKNVRTSSICCSDGGSKKSKPSTSLLLTLRAWKLKGELNSLKRSGRIHYKCQYNCGIIDNNYKDNNNNNNNNDYNNNNNKDDNNKDDNNCNN